MRPIHIEGGKVLIDGGLSETSVTLEGGVITEIGDPCPPGALIIDASDLLVLPGIIDIHGDAFERQIMPRPGVQFPHALALLDTDRQLAAAGITTAYHGLTLSWEPGLRSVDAAAGFLRVLKKERSRLAGLSVDEYLAQLNDVWKRRSEVRTYVEHLAAKARDNGVVMLSHDDRTMDERSFYRDLGASIAEFPITRDAIDDARMNDEPTVLGAPNVVRGGSHTHALNATDMINAGKCTVLASDYHYPSMLAAIGRLIETHGHKVENTWRLISEAPADALGLQDRGRIAPCLRADLMLVAFETNFSPRVFATTTEGKLVHLQGHERLS